MTDFVIDASAVVAALTGKTAVGILVHQRIVEGVCHAPHLIDAETGHVLRRLIHLGEITNEVAQTSLRALDSVIDERYPHTGEVGRLAWELRHDITYYDALYVALATVLDVPLITTDAKLAAAPGLTCEVDLVR